MTDAVGIPYDVYMAEDGDVCWVPGGTEEQARDDAEYATGLEATAVHPVHLRYVTGDEAERLWGATHGVVECEPDTPGVGPGWRVDLNE